METRHIGSNAEQAPTRRRAPQGRPPDLSEGFILSSVSDGPLFEAAEEFVYDVYRQMEYCDESHSRRVEELQPWSSGSVFHVVHSLDNEVIGTCRNIFGAYEALPIGQLERHDRQDGDPVVEMSAMAIEPTARSSGVIEHLLRASWLYAMRLDCQALVAVVEPWFLEVFQLSYRLPWREIGAGRDYMGGYSLPIGLTLAGSSFERLCRELPEFWRWGLEACTPEEIARWELPLILTDPPEGVEVAAEAEERSNPQHA